MDVRATSRYLPISPTKIRLVCDRVRGMPPRQAVDVLRHMPQKGAGLLLKVVKSAMANAENNFELDPGEMLISAVYANEGPRRPWRRFGARGRFKPWIRRTSHVTVVLSEEQVVVAADAGEEQEE
ncbi:MAG: 50S ribosomal protein L22 [Anaerolineae bacterium]|nr:50S ribosomal protein L22 [Anaerolineae bacterium]